MPEPLPFYPGFAPTSARLLGRFLPPLADGVAAHYLQKHTRPGDLVFDPFAQAPAVALEALSLERRVVVASFNPVSRLALSLALRPPSIAQLRSALTQLGDAAVGRGPADRLERQIRDLYATTCPECGSPAEADSFEWDATINEPVTRIYQCARCGGGLRQAAVDEADRAQARRFGRSGLGYYYLLDRVASASDPDRVHAEEALTAYPPRTLAAIGTLLPKFDTLAADRDTRRLLAGLLVAAFDATTTLTQDRPKALAEPRRYTELNVWLALEHALTLLAGVPAPERGVSLAEVLAGGSAGIYAHAGSVRELAGLLPPRSVRLVLTAVPRPNQAYWALSAVWAAWLWGRESAEALRAVLRRRRYDWAWHANALQRTFAQAGPTLMPGGRVVGLVPEAEPGFSASVIAGAHGAGWRLIGAALRADAAEAQLEWRAGLPPEAEERGAAAPSEAEIARALVGCLAVRAEPSPWASLHFAAWQQLAVENSLRWLPDDPLGPAQRVIDAAAQTGRLVRLGAANEPGAGTWHLAEPEASRLGSPLGDRVEVAVLQALLPGEPLEEAEVHQQICRQFPGAQTPGRALVQACLVSYAEQDEAGLWRLRPEDTPAARAEAVETTRAALETLGARQGYEVTGTQPQQWSEAGRLVFLFYITPTAALGHFLLAPYTSRLAQARRRYLVIPGGRAGLADVRLRRDPRLRHALDAGRWCLLKFRQVRRLAAEAGLDRSGLEAALAGDPVEAHQQLTLQV